MQKKPNKVKKVSKFVNNQFDFLLCITILLLLALGIIMVLSASAPSALASENDSYAFVKKQAGFAVLGIALMFIISKIDYRFYKKYYWMIYFVSWAILLLVVVPGIGKSVKGATRWINLGFGQFQPSEITKIGLIIFYAGYLSDHKDDLKYFFKGFVKPFLFLVPPIGILFLVQNHLSVSLVIGSITAVMMLMAGARVLHFVQGAGVRNKSEDYGLLGVLQMTGKGGFRLDRIATFFDPWADAQGTGYQVVQSLYAIGSGGLFGVGLGESKQKFLYIPEPHNDFIFSILSEELGFIGCIVVIILFAIFIWRGILIAMKAPDMFGSLIAVGVTSLVAVQAIINIAVVTASIPTTGMPLPFFSYGGTALLILLCSCGILLNISRAGSKV
ncbi:MAG: putative lipid II flippase FtsW [Clostridia bacterium]|nr:putative lipid II flippase FtsW [Clostridia bacterium]